MEKKKAKRKTARDDKKVGVGQGDASMAGKAPGGKDKDGKKGKKKNEDDQMDYEEVIGNLHDEMKVRDEEYQEMRQNV